MKEYQLIKSDDCEAYFLEIDEIHETYFESIHPAIIFVTEATVTIRFSSDEKKVIPKGQFFLLPRNLVCHFLSETFQKIMILIIPDMRDLYVYFFSHLPHKEINSFRELFYPLTMNWPIQSFTKGMVGYLNDKTINTNLTGIKTLELFYLLKHFFSKESLISFFTPVFSKEYEFALSVFSNYHRVKTAKELAHLCNYTFSGFEKQFKKVFSVSPYHWMLQRKIDKVYWEIYKTSKPIKVIAVENGFCSASSLGDFCRKHLGDSPTGIRRK